MFSMNTLKLLFRVDEAHIISSSFTRGTLCRVKNSFQQNLSLLGIKQAAFMFSALNQLYLVKKCVNTPSGFPTNPLFELASSRMKHQSKLLCTWLGTLHILCPLNPAWQTAAVGEPVAFLIWTSCSQMRTKSHFKEMASGSKVTLQQLLMHTGREKSD